MRANREPEDYKLLVRSTHKGIVVTTSGFQEGAKRMSKAKGIVLVSVHPNDLISWKVLMAAIISLLCIGGEALVQSMSSGQSLKAEPSKQMQTAEISPLTTAPDLLRGIPNK